MARIPTCMCNNCNAIGTVKIEIANRGKGNGYMCEFHARQKESYTTENDFRKGNRKANGFTFSMELETSFSNERIRGELLNKGFLPTYDCTVDVEYKSPIFEGLNAISKQAVSIESYMGTDELRMDRDCGTHFHVGHAVHINPETMRYLRRFNGSLFVPLSNAIMANPDKARRFFGRHSNGWAEPVTMSDPSGDFEGWRMKHSAMFNLQHDYTIEFRQAKFVSANQYMNVAKFARDIVNCIINNFILHFNEQPTDTRRYPTIREYRVHKAQVTANKMVALYEKYTANV